MMAQERWIPIAMAITKAIVYVYDIITLPIYLILQKPWKTLANARKIKAKSLTGKPEGPYVNTHASLQSIPKLEGRRTMSEMFERAVQANHSNRCMGTREIFSEEDEIQPDGTVLKKYVMGEYLWQSYDEINNRMNNFAKALNNLGYGPGKNVLLFAETRAEWLIACVGCFMNNITVVTLYATLGDDAIVYGINETEATLVITSQDLLPKFKKLQSRIPKVKQIIFMEGFKKLPDNEYPSRVVCTTFKNIEKQGEQLKGTVKLHKPTAKDVAVIMYTSGSTGVPKGVMISQLNLTTAWYGVSNVIDANKDDIYIAYLPLAHVVELLAEFLALLRGVPIGYSSPLTITNMSSKIKAGCKGDAVVLKPTIMASVPMILNRIFKTVQNTLNDKGGFAKVFFEFAYNYKLYYTSKGFKTPILDRLVFQKTADILGGRLRLMVTGGAPIVEETHNFIKHCFSCFVAVCYGLTETSACGSGLPWDDMSVGRIGSPYHGTEMMLRDWKEGNYRVTDKPYPRGEIIIGGDNVCIGYWKKESTEEDFFEKYGKRWFATGDIGECHPDGIFKLIDRKKDIVKLQFGEYIALGKVETELSRLAIVDNSCVYGDSTKDFVVALVVPNERTLLELGAKLGKGDLSIEQMCADPEMNKAVEKLIIEHCKSTSLHKFEIPRRAKLCSETWTPDSGLVTHSHKLKRKFIQDHYQSAINEMYS